MSNGMARLNKSDEIAGLCLTLHSLQTVGYARGLGDVIRTQRPQALPSAWPRPAPPHPTPPLAATGIQESTALWGYDSIARRQRDESMVMDTIDSKRYPASACGRAEHVWPISPIERVLLLCSVNLEQQPACCSSHAQPDDGPARCLDGFIGFRWVGVSTAKWF